MKTWNSWSVFFFASISTFVLILHSQITYFLSFPLDFTRGTSVGRLHVFCRRSATFLADRNFFLNYEEIPARSMRLKEVSLVRE